MPAPVIGFGLLALLACSPAGHPIVTEVVYDATGDDTGWEFVELWNPGDAAMPLAGVRIEAGDGAGPGRWSTRWTGGASDTIRAHARFVVGGASVTPAVDAVVTLELQNGPDALRVTWPDGASETLGWGALAYPEYACGAPAVDVPSGRALARIPDDAQSGSNAGDFREAEPTPGRANRPATDAALVPGTLALIPEQPAPGEVLVTGVRVRNAGASAIAAGAAALLLSGDALADSVAVTLAAFAPGETLAVTASPHAGAAGRRVLRARVTAPGDEAAANDADSLAVRVGPGLVEITEIQFHPAAGEGEWVELRNRGGESLALASLTFSDRADGRSRVVCFTPLAPESLAVIAQDRAALLAAYPSLDTARVASATPWPSLNNSDDAGGIADVVTLRESDGLPADRVAYSASGVPMGASLEKRGGGWAPAANGSGTPLVPPREDDAHGADFRVTPRRVALAGAEVAFAWRLPWPRGRVSVELYDLAGRRVARLLDELSSAAEGERHVGLAGLPPGLYVAVLRARGERGTIERTATLRLMGASGAGASGAGASGARP